MKILNVVYDLDKGGTQRAAQNFCEAYAVLGHDSKMLATMQGGIRKDELEKENIQVWVTLSEQNLEEIARWKPNVIHLHSHGVTFKDVTILKNLCPEALFVETNVFSVPSDYSHLLDYSYQLSNWCKFLYLSRGGSKELCVKVPYPVKVTNFFKVPKEEADAFRSKYDIPEDAFLFGRVGQNFFGKWSLYLIDVFDKFNKKVSANSFLVVVNPPQEVVDYVDYLGLHNKVVIIDKLYGDEELRRCYSAIDVFLHIANQGESFGQVLAESLLCETPVITMNTPWDDNSQAEVVGNNIGGLCANTRKGFYERMKILYHDAELRQRLGKGGREHILENYDYLKVAQKSVNYIIKKGDDLSYNIPFTFQNLPKDYPKRSIPLLWMKLHTKQHRLGNYLLRRMVNFKWKKVEVK